MDRWPASPFILGDPESLEKHKRKVFARMRIRLPRGGEIPYEPHEHQAKVHFPGKLVTHQAIVAGRRGGKSKVGEAEALAMMGIKGTTTWVGAPTYALTDRIFQPIYRALVIEKIFVVSPVRERNNPSHRYIEMPWGAILEGKSAEKPASSKGASLDLFIDDECAEHDESYFTEYVGPGLADRQGRAMFPSTPLGLTWFEEYYKRGQSAKYRQMGWYSYRWRSEDNPFLDKDWLRQQRLVLPAHVWQQEYEAKFLARSGLIWEDFRDEYMESGGHLFNPDTRPVGSDWVHFRGIDIGHTGHPTGCVWGAVDPQNNIWIYDEYWKKGRLHEEHANAIAARTVHPIFQSFISWEAETADGKGGETALQIYQNQGIYCQKAPRGLEVRVDAVASYLRAALQDASIHPAMYISDRCTRLRHQMKKYRHKDLKPNVEAGRLKPHAKGKGDDLCDALGHLCVTKPRYMPQWMEPDQEMDEVKRYGHQNSAFTRSRPKGGFIGIPGLGTIPRVN